jgi:hypothetical protein
MRFSVDAVCSMTSSFGVITMCEIAAVVLVCDGKIQEVKKACTGNVAFEHT